MNIYSVKHFWAGCDDEFPPEYFVESNSLPTPTEALKILNDNGENIEFEPDKGESITVHLLDVKKAKSPKKKFIHYYALGFSVLTDQPENATADEILEGLHNRINDLNQDPREILEACGCPDDIIDND
jgi:hypothetical protein